MTRGLEILRQGMIALAGAAVVLTPLWFIVVTSGGKMGFWEPLDSFRHVLGFAGLNILGHFGLSGGFGSGFILPLTAALGVGALFVGVVSHFVPGVRKTGTGGFAVGVLALFVGTAPLALVTISAGDRADIPPIHDITTDTENPPQFTASLIDRRGPDANPVDYASKTDPRSGRPLPEVQAEAYPDIGPVLVLSEPALAYQAALGAAREMGWTVSTASEASLMFEATATTFWFGFKDDIVVRVTALDEGGSRVDARSVSRVGASDLGANAARLREFEARLRASLGET